MMLGWRACVRECVPRLWHCHGGPPCIMALQVQHQQSSPNSKHVMPGTACERRSMLATKCMVGGMSGGGGMGRGGHEDKEDGGF